MKNTLYLVIVMACALFSVGCGRSVADEKTVVKAGSDLSVATDSDNVSQRDIVICCQTVATDVIGVDSLQSYYMKDSADVLERMFTIAKGGNIECLADSFAVIGGSKFVIFTVADYSQEDQIYYILFNSTVDSLYQSERINLATAGISISDYKSLRIDSLTDDSIYISSPVADISVESIKLDCDTARIINYYEYQ